MQPPTPSFSGVKHDKVKHSVTFEDTPFFTSSVTQQFVSHEFPISPSNPFAITSYVRVGIQCLRQYLFHHFQIRLGAF